MKETKKYKQIQEELSPFHTIMDRAVNAVLEQEISKYPIMIVSVSAVDLGIPLIDGRRIKHPCQHVGRDGNQAGDPDGKS